MVGKVRKVERVGKSGNGKGCGPTNSGSATSRRNRSARFCHMLRCVIRYVWYNVCVCVCVCEDHIHTLYPTNSLEDIYRIVAINSTAVSVFQICVVNLFDSIWTNLHAERGGGRKIRAF